MIYCLNKSFGGFYRFNVLLNRKMPLYSLYPFLRNGCKAYLRSKNTPLLFKELIVIIYLLYTPLPVKGELLNLHMR
jgi:hypothetical protein